MSRESFIQLNLGLGLDSNNANCLSGNSIPEGQLDLGLIKPERTATILINTRGNLNTIDDRIRSVEGLGVVHLTAGDFDFEVGLYDKSIDEIKSIVSQLSEIPGTRLTTLITMYFPERGIYTDITKTT